MTNLLLLVAFPICVSIQLLQAADLPLPVVLPPFNIDGGIKPSDNKTEYASCLLYMEGLGFVISQPTQSPKGWGAVIGLTPDKSHKFTWDSSYVDCKNLTQKPTNDKTFTPQYFSFTVKVTTGAPVEAKQKEKDPALFTIEKGKTFTLILRFRTLVSYGWQLYEIESQDGISIKSGGWLKENIDIKAGSRAKNETVPKMEIGAYNGYNYACGDTKIALFQTDGDGKLSENYKLGVFFHNLQIQHHGYVVQKDGKIHFSHNTADCVGTFSHGSLMGIIVALVLASVLVFGFLMLNSVQTVDRFDDPKQKQLIINSKD